MVLNGGEVLGVRGQAVVEREGVAGGVEEGSILIGVDVLTVRQLLFARVSFARENLLNRDHGLTLATTGIPGRSVYVG
jgi:hypothetical protein